MFTEDQIIYEDNHLFVVNKRSGELVQPDPSGTSALEDQIKAFIKVRDAKPGEVFLGVVHRIDRPVSGVVLFTKTSKALVRLNEMIRQRNISKRYWAIVESVPKASAVSEVPAVSEASAVSADPKAPAVSENPKNPTNPFIELTHHITRDTRQNKSRATQTPREGSKEARLRYRILGHSNNYTLLEIELITGRHHQIRAQLSAIGSPIKGDLKYGARRSNPDGGISLHSRELSFTHPVTKQSQRAVAAVPEDKLWQFFERMVK